MEKSKIHKIEIYEFDFEVVVTDDMVKAQNSKERIGRLGEGKTGDYQGLTWYRGRNLGILLSKPYINHNLIAHEVFHAAHVMLEFCGHKFDAAGHEPFAYLVGYLTEIIYKDLRKWKIRVR